jgi:hypothetical protein
MEAPACGIAIKANYIRLQTSNIHISDYAQNGIRVEGDGNTLLLDNTWIEKWNTSGSGFPGVEVVNQSTVYLGKTTLFENGNGALPLKGNVISDN